MFWRSLIIFLAGLLPALTIPAQGGQKPSDLIDLSHWLLTLPEDTEREGTPDEVFPHELATFSHDNWFFVAEDKRSVLFRAPAGGATTDGSKYPRCELREMNEGCDSRAAWSTEDSLLHTLDVTLAVTKIPPVKPHIVCAQIHDADDDVLMVRLEGKKLFVEREGAPRIMLTRKYDLGTFFRVKIESGYGRIRLWYNGELKMDWNKSADGCYFKTGCYLQSNPGKGEAPDAVGEVVIQKLVKSP